MDIERLKELKNVVVLNSWLSERAKKELTTLIDEAIARQLVKSDIGETSDGYHTFNELYHHRAILFAALSKAYPDKAWKSLKHHDGTMFDDETFICGIETPKGHYTYHYNTTYWPLFAGKILDNSPEWDGHKPEDVERLMSLQGYQKPTDDAVQRAIEWAEQERKDNFRYMNFGDADSATLAIDALRQMRSEPCECTEICGICNNPNYHIHSGIWWKSASTEYGRENREIPTRHCPNCGRKLVK